MKRKRYNDPQAIKDLLRPGGKLHQYYSISRADYDQLARRIGASPYVACVLDNLYYGQKLGDIQVSDDLTEALSAFVEVTDENGTLVYVINHDTLTTIEDWRGDQDWTDTDFLDFD